MVELGAVVVGMDHVGRGKNASVRPSFYAMANRWAAWTSDA